jgi:integrase
VAADNPDGRRRRSRTLLACAGSLLDPNSVGGPDPSRVRSRRRRKLDGGTCNCEPSYEAWAWSPREQKKLRKTFTNLNEAKNWRADSGGAIRKGTLRSPTKTTLREAAEAWLAGARDGSIRTRSGDPFKPSTVRGYDQALALRVLPELGALRLSELRRSHLQDLCDGMLADGADASTIRNTLMPVRAIYRRAVSRGDVTVNPTASLDLPAVRGRRDRIADPAEAAVLLEALPEADRATWATAMYAGLRLGELRALRWEDVDLTAGIIRVERSWDPAAGVIEPKSQAGKRTVPIASVLREHLVRHALATGRRSGLVFGRSADEVFAPPSVWRRSQKAWENANAKRVAAELEPLQPIGLHECRHTFASLMIASGVNAKTLAAFMGHASVTTTLDRYGHLFPGAETQAAALLDGYLERATGAQTGAQ